VSNLDNGKRLAAAGAAVLLSALLAAPPAEAGRTADDFARTLGSDERQRFEAWYSAQIFFDASGRERYRHEGFMSREAILTKWEELGIDLPRKPGGLPQKSNDFPPKSGNRSLNRPSVTS